VRDLIEEDPAWLPASFAWPIRLRFMRGCLRFDPRRHCQNGSPNGHRPGQWHGGHDGVRRSQGCGQGRARALRGHGRHRARAGLPHGRPGAPAMAFWWPAARHGQAAHHADPPPELCGVGSGHRGFPTNSTFRNANSWATITRCWAGMFWPSGACPIRAKIVACTTTRARYQEGARWRSWWPSCVSRT